MSANDTEFPELIRTRAAGQWSPWDIVIAFALEGWGSPVAALLWVLAAVFMMPLTFLWGRFKRTHLDKDQQFVTFHGEQMEILCNVLWLGTILTCGCGFPVLLIPAILAMRAGRRAALQGEWWSLPLFGWIVKRPAL